jgi:hypothetical protein
MDEVSVEVRDQSIRLALDDHQLAGTSAEERPPLEAAFGNVTVRHSDLRSAVTSCKVVL